MNGSPRPASPLAPGLTVGHYAVVSLLGRGGMGEVFLARDIDLDRKVALKVLSREFIGDGDHLQRFQREARNLANLSHPNIVTVFAVEELQGQHVLSMEYVDGCTLRKLTVPGGLALERFLEIAVALADAVGAAHERGVTHRDLKPENVMVTDSGRVKVLDFGLAKTRAAAGAPAAAGRDGDTLTQDGALLGTLPYMSPEQAEGRQLDHRSDIFALGVMFYELLSGERPFTGQTGAGILSSILRDTPISMTVRRPEVPVELARLVRMCLQKDPAQRFQSALDVRNELQGLLDEIRWKKQDSHARWARTARPRRPTALFSLESRTGLTMLLVAVLVVNWLETTIETGLRARFRLGEELAYDLARAMSWFERGLSFERHDLSNQVAIYAGSVAYFFLPLVLGSLTIVTLTRRPDLSAYRTFALAITATYLLSLGFYLFFPVPERWAYPESEAVLLSDLWSVKLIQAFRPISGIDNCFPSFHVASTVTILLIWFTYELRFRHAVACLSLAVILSTFLLGIHWLADIIAGGALGVVSLRLAMRVNSQLELAKTAANRTTVGV